MNIHAVLEQANPRAIIGGNNPPVPINLDAPSLIDRARSFYTILSAFLKNTPVIQSHNDAKQAANYVEQARATIGEIEDTRKRRVTPLNDEVKAINEEYRTPRETLQSLMDEVKRRLTAFAVAEEAERQRAAEAARIAAAEAERIAREAEAVEVEAKACADVGEIGVNVAAAITQADKAFDTFKRADRTAARAERAVPVRLSGGMGRAVSMRRTETLVLDDAVAAITAIGPTEKVRDAILSSARDYRKLHGKLPAGVSAEIERQF
jgi:hypothetical protein